MTTSLYWYRTKLAQIKNTASKVRSSGVSQEATAATVKLPEGGQKLPQQSAGGPKPPPAAPVPAAGTSIIIEPALLSKQSLLGLEYSSSLEHLRSREEGAGARLDPHAMLCRFQLDGECRDSQCEYQHLRPSS